MLYRTCCSRKVAHLCEHAHALLGLIAQQMLYHTVLHLPSLEKRTRTVAPLCESGHALLVLKGKHMYKRTTGKHALLTSAQDVLIDDVVANVKEKETVYR